MKTFLLLLLVILAVVFCPPFCFGQGRPLTPEEQRKVLEQIRDTVKQLQTERDDLLNETDVLRQELDASNGAVDAAKAQVDVKQLEVNKVTDWGNAQAHAKDVALGERDRERDRADAEKKLKDEAITHLNKLKFWLCSAGALIVAFLVFQFTSKIPVPGVWGLVLRIGGPLLAFSLAYALLWRWL